ncbi:hypothetical protein Nham_1362 [Nitrobacter hamburgensis X14]|uniref:Uncharacterized protein n=1 Tax=Nitrobacter hamburgensis (strain DSM 10229 / NCIMB 13809 / X14) TaxID=323097 RepID=Q1QNL1_NITHX|nr:hypothetical protein Nham_1362 [Nitrobacter hamburgensis X14]
MVVGLVMIAMYHGAIAKPFTGSLKFDEFGLQNLGAGLLQKCPHTLAAVVAFDDTGGVAGPATGKCVRGLHDLDRVVGNVGQVGPVGDPHGADRATVRFISAGDEVDRDGEHSRTPS